MGGTKNPATKSTGGVKIAALGEELRVDPRSIVAAAKEMAMENAKVPASWVTAGQADRLRAKFGGQDALKAKIERKLRHFESALETPSGAANAEAAAKEHAPKAGKKTYEADRRAVFGVVATPGGVRVDHLEGHAKPHAKKKENAKAEPYLLSATSKTTSVLVPPAPAAAVEPETASATEEPVAAHVEIPAQPATKFIGVQVSAPIRRDPAGSDPRFGVVVPSPVEAGDKKADGSALWEKLNDGSAPVNFAPVTKRIEPPAPEVPAEKVEEKPAVAESKSEVVVHDPDRQLKESADHAASVEYMPLAPKMEEVPVKWQPKHKAYGAKVKLKAKALRKLQDNGAGEHTQARRHSEPAEKNEPKHHAPQHKTEAPRKPESKRKAAHASEQSEGIFKRLIRKIFKK